VIAPGRDSLSDDAVDTPGVPSRATAIGKRDGDVLNDATVEGRRAGASPLHASKAKRHSASRADDSVGKLIPTPDDSRLLRRV
jgi:hypothetical protein